MFQYFDKGTYKQMKTCLKNQIKTSGLKNTVSEKYSKWT